MIDMGYSDAQGDKVKEKVCDLPRATECFQRYLFSLRKTGNIHRTLGTLHRLILVQLRGSHTEHIRAVGGKLRTEDLPASRSIREVASGKTAVRASLETM